jgi:hypothetical protein
MLFSIRRFTSRPEMPELQFVIRIHSLLPISSFLLSNIHSPLFPDLTHHRGTDFLRSERWPSGKRQAVEPQQGGEFLA